MVQVAGCGRERAVAEQRLPQGILKQDVLH